MAESRTFRPRRLEDILPENRDGAGHVKEAFYWPYLDQTGQVLGMLDLPRIAVTIDPLGTRAQQAFRSQIIREAEAHIAWDQGQYNAIPAGIYRFRSVVVHSQAGIICFDDQVVAETLWHTSPEKHHFSWRDGCIVVPDGRAQRLRGRTLSLLGVAENYFHSVIDGVARLALVPDGMLAGIDHVLLPEGGVGQSELIRIHGLPPTVSVRYVRADDTYCVDELVFPWTLHGVFDFHPQMNAFFDRVRANSPAVVGSPTHIYIDRRSSELRRLVNEDAVVEAVESVGFLSVRLETLSQREQIALFQGAHVIVSPHGAGLTNIGFASPGTIVIELVMDAYLNWCYRRMANVRRLRYDCVLGEAIGAWKPPGSDFHSQQWSISVQEVTETIRAAMTGN